MEFRVPAGKVCVFVYDEGTHRMKPRTVDIEAVPPATAFVCQSCGCQEQVVHWNTASNGNTPGMYYYGCCCANPECFSNQRRESSNGYDSSNAD
jgi:hypothetical protein